MIIVRESNPWRRHFAWLPVTFHSGPTKTTVWLEPYWSRMDGYYEAISLTDPTKPEGEA